MAFDFNTLTEGIRDRHVGTENKRLVEKWNRTGLLKGLGDERKEVMARLLENQTAQILREANSLGAGAGSMTASGDIRGFTNIAFPIVRRVFGGLVANELVSIQPMSLPSGLLFYMDYAYGSSRGGNTGIDGTNANNAATYVTGTSIYGNPIGKGVQSGSLGAGGMYDLVGAGFSRVHVSTALAAAAVTASGSYRGSGTFTAGQYMHATGTDGRLLQFDPQISTLIETDAADGTYNGLGSFSIAILPFNTTYFPNVDPTMPQEIALFKNVGTTVGNVPIPGDIQGGTGILNVRRLNQLGTWSSNAFTANPLITTSDANASVLMILSGTMAGGDQANLTVSYVQASALDVESSSGSTLTIPSFESNFAVSPSPAIPEIDIKVESIPVVAQTRKLRARWSPELAQDLNAYHSLDAELELTQILSEQIALELDREILNDLLVGGNAAKYYWSRAPGKFLNKTTGAQVFGSTGANSAGGPAFTGTVREWYETLVETIIDVANEIHRKTLRGSANFIVVSPDVSTILESSVLYRPSYSIDGNGQVGQPISIGAEKVGTLSGRFTVYKDPYFPRNKILVGFKGSGALESGYVYAPYVPLIVTPTIFAPEDFTPRKGVLTRYGKKMVRSDFFGTVTVNDLNTI